MSVTVRGAAQPGRRRLSSSLSPRGRPAAARPSPRVSFSSAHVIDVVGEDPLDDRAAGVDPVGAQILAADHLAEAHEGPSVEAVLDDAERRIERVDERCGAEDVLEVVVARAVVAGIGERRRIGSGCAGEVAQPEHTLAGGMADGRPERPALGRRAQRQLLFGQRPDDVAQVPVVGGPLAVGRSDGQLAHALTVLPNPGRILSGMVGHRNRALGPCTPAAGDGGRYWIRTSDLADVNRAL